MEVPIDEAGFVIPPVSLNVAVACLVVLWIMRSIGKRAHDRGDDRQGMVLDIINLFTVSSLIAALATLPLIASLASRVAEAIISATGSETINTGAGIGLGIILVGIGIWYAKSEKFYVLLIFGLVALVAASLSSTVNGALSWWTNNPVSWLWNLIVGVVTEVGMYSF